MRAITEEDVTKTINYLKVHDPKNADREYAVQPLELMQQFAQDLVTDDPELAEKLLQVMRKKSRSSNLDSESNS